MIPIPPLEAHVANLRAAATSARAAADATSKMALDLALVAHNVPAGFNELRPWKTAARAARMTHKLVACASRLDGDLANAEDELACAKNGGIRR